MNGRESVERCWRTLGNRRRRDEEEDGRDLGGSGERVLDRGVFWQELRREIRVGDILVMRRESVALQAERAYPKLPANVYLAWGPSASAHERRGTRRASTG